MTTSAQLAALAPTSDWIGFFGIVAFLLLLDLAIFRRGRASGLRAGLLEFAAWTAVAAAFAVAVGLRQGPERSQQFLAGYLIELSLSADNLFVFVLVFDRFQIGPERQHRVLFWGIMGAAVLRTAFIIGGVSAIHRAHWLVPAGGALILATGAKLGLSRREPEGLGAVGGALSGFLSRWLRADDGPGGDRFFVGENGRRRATPLFASLVVLEAADLIFALDSLPAVIAVTRDPFIAISSNILAILGLRSLYLVVHDSVRLFRFLRPGLSALLVFVGAKMLADRWIHVSTMASLAVIGAILAVSIGASLVWRPKREKAGGGSAPGL